MPAQQNAKRGARRAAKAQEPERVCDLHLRMDGEDCGGLQSAARVSECVEAGANERNGGLVM
jgi:hypothetical protein